MPKKHYADADYQRDRRSKIKSGEIVPGAKRSIAKAAKKRPDGKIRRVGLVDTLREGGAWLEDFSSRLEANAFQRTVSAIAHRHGLKVRCKTFVCVDPDTDEAAFIVKAQRRDEVCDDATDEISSSEHG